jgi:hypothetical protein
MRDCVAPGLGLAKRHPGLPPPTAGGPARDHRVDPLDIDSVGAMVNMFTELVH